MMHWGVLMSLAQYTYRRSYSYALFIISFPLMESR